MKNVFLAGSTGSIGRSAIDIAISYPDYINITAIAAGHFSIGLIKQIIELNPLYCHVPFKEDAVKIISELSSGSNTATKVIYGESQLKDIVFCDDVDIILNAISGSSGLMLSYWTILAKKDLALANKESIVMAGDILTKLSKHTSSKIIPVDSEHSAIFQCLNCGVKKDVKKLILTASGGPFFGTEMSKLNNVTKEMALNHPKWKMGKKITIDSSTLANKGLEIIEAHYLFDIEEKNIDVIMHPEAVIHSMVEFIDGSIIAQIAVADMKGPIGYALSYPERFKYLMKSIDFAKIGNIKFFEPDNKKFPFLELAREALRIGKSMPSVFSEANEFFVQNFLDGKIRFTDIAANVKRVMDMHLPFELNTIEDVLETKKLAQSLFDKVHI